MKNKPFGYLLGAIAACTYGMNPLFSLPLYSDGLKPDMVLLLRYGFALPIVALVVRLRGRSFKVEKDQWPFVIALGLLMALSSKALFHSYNYMDAGIASTLLFVYPLMVALIMAFFFHEKLTLPTGFSIALALIGIVMLYQGGNGATLSLAGTLMVMASSLTYAIYIVTVNRSRIRLKPTIELTFWVLVVGAIFFAITCGTSNSYQLPSKWYLWINALCLGIFPTVISFLCTTRAINIIGSTPTAILGALEPVTALFFGYFVFGEIITPRDSIGIVLIVIAVTLVVASSKLGKWLSRSKKLFPHKRV
ncbi:MAG: DMT family transporter [Bacteroidales bacterium]|nr:DMT family transporter [Bacteroidales bacterium]